MLKSAFLVFISFFYTLLYVFVLDEDLFIFSILSKCSKYGGGVSSEDIKIMRILLFSFLTIAVILLVIFLFKKIQGNFIYIFIPSLLASFLLPLFFDSINSKGFISFPWYFTGLLLFAGNLLIGPSMFFLISYFVMTKLKGC